MSKFSPKSGTLALDLFEYPQAGSEPELSMNLTVEFEELMDPDDPRSEDCATVTIDDVPLPLVTEWKEMEGMTLTDLDEDDPPEGSIHYYGCHNPVDLHSITFGSIQDQSISATLWGVIDFTYEGLARLGKPEFEWRVNLTFDPDAVEATLAKLRS